MEGFKVNPKMAKNLPCYAEGGSVKYKSRHSEKSEKSEDIAKDKAIVKKAVKIHDVQQHEGKETNLSKLKKGGRMKKEGGCVGRYKDGGSIKMKKDAADLKDIQKIKLTKTKKAAAPSKAAIKPAMSNIAEPAPDMGAMPPMMKKGGYAKKYADGGIVANIKAVGKKAYENVMGTPEQNKAAAEQEKAIAEKDPSSYEAKYRKLTGKKEGGKACR
jgi:hypothetical protein